jgi:hypothetical protein
MRSGHLLFVFGMTTVTEQRIRLRKKGRVLTVVGIMAGKALQIGEWFVRVRRLFLSRSLISVTKQTGSRIVGAIHNSSKQCWLVRSMRIVTTPAVSSHETGMNGSPGVLVFQIGVTTETELVIIRHKNQTLGKSMPFMTGLTLLFFDWLMNTLLRRELLFGGLVAIVTGFRCGP